MHFLFAWRYFKAKKSTNAINIIAWTSIVAIIVGTAALILVLSVFNGFEGLVKSLYSNFYTDLKVMPATGKTMQVSPQQLQRIKELKDIRNFSMIAEEKAFIQNNDYQSVVFLKGVDENYRYTTGVANHLVSGEYDLGTSESPKVILGAGVENALGIIADLDIPKVYLPRRNNSEQLDPLEDISNDSIISSGTFMIQQDFDNKYGITNLEFVKRSMQLGPDEYSAVEISLKDPSTTERVRSSLQSIFGNSYLVLNRYEQNRSLYSVMTMERWVIYGILCLILVVAAFNMIGALTMLVLEKQKDISVLHALGGDRNFIQRVFLSEGVVLAVTGGGIGMLLALLIAWLQLQFHIIPLGGSFMISHFPVELKLMDFLLVGGTVLIIAILASWLPARKAARHEFSLRSE